MAEVFYRCTACRRCTLECPLGIDHGLITRLGRWILAEVGIVPKALQVSVREQLEGATRNTSEIPARGAPGHLRVPRRRSARRSTACSWSFPSTSEGADYVFFRAVSDYLMEPDTLMGNAAVLYADRRGPLDDRHQDFDGINYGLFYSDWHLERIIRQPRPRRSPGSRAAKILIGECGHASRSAKDFVPTFGGSEASPVVNFMEYTLRGLERREARARPGRRSPSGSPTTTLQPRPLRLDRRAAA